MADDQGRDGGNLDAARRRHARRQIESGPEAPSPLPPLSPERRRRLTADERRAYQARRQQPIRPTAPEPRERRSRPPAGLLILGGVLIAVLVVLAVAGGELFGTADDADPTATAVVSAATPEPVAAPTEPSQPTVPLVSNVPEHTADGERVVCLDPGHGGQDRGFTRADDGVLGPMEEGQINLSNALAVEAGLQERGITVVMTRRTDAEASGFGVDVNGDGEIGDWGTNQRAYDFDELQARINICNAAGADLLVSMHINGHPDAEREGYEVFFTQERPFGDVSHRFATIIYRHLGEEMNAVGYPAVERGVQPDTESGVPDAPGRLQHYVITGPSVEGRVVASQMPGAIVETLYISNAEDAQFLATDYGRAAIVRAYVNAIEQYFEEFPG